MGCYQGPYVEEMRGTLANVGGQYKSHQVAPAVLHTARRAYTLSMERRVTRKGACQAPTLFSGHRMGTCVCLNGRRCERRHRAMQCAPPQHTCSAQVPRVCTPQNNITHSVHGVLVSLASAGGSPSCPERSQLRAITSNPRNNGRGQGEPTQGQTRRLKQPKRHFFTFWPKRRNPCLGWFGRLSCWDPKQPLSKPGTPPGNYYRCRK